MEALAGALATHCLLIAGELVGIYQKIRRSMDWEAPKTWGRNSVAFGQKEAASWDRSGVVAPEERMAALEEGVVALEE